ncbi:hypothetical protein [Tenacibaculum dicentrarchi]|uniref:hypothetical protein n=1 Tax=Tenacibaculum dicentrarchi TaxID=669041 RepID=UPI003517AB50
MIDYNKVILQNIDTERLRALRFLHFKGIYDDDTGEIESKLVAKHHYCTITIYKNGTVMFTGSIHKMYNSLKGILAPNYYKTKEFYKGYNGNDFTLFQIVEVRQYLELLFDCEPEQMKFQNIEFGYNLQLPFASKLFLKGLLHHKGKPFEVRFGTSYQCKHQNIIIKIYDKAIQYEMQGNILRTEIRVCRASDLLKLGIKSFADINTTTLKKATELLKNKLKEVVYFDYTIDSKTFGTVNKRKYLEFQIPNFLIDLSSENRKRPKRELQEFINNYSDNLKEQIQKEVDKKCTLITWFENLEICYFSIKKCIKYSRFSYGKNPQIKNKKCTLITTSSINVNRVQNTIEKRPRICLITGINISMQKEDSFLLSHTGLKHLIKTDFKEFEKIRNKYIYPKYRFSDIEIQIKEVAHAIRDKNIIRNNNNNPNQTSIFYN